MLDEAITLAEHDINDVDCEIKLDYKESFKQKRVDLIFKSGFFVLYNHTVKIMNLLKENL